MKIASYNFVSKVNSDECADVKKKLLFGSHITTQKQSNPKFGMIR